MPPTSPIPESLLEDRLPDWWRPLGVDITGVVEPRRKAIAELAEGLRTADLVDVVAFAYGDATAGRALIDRVRQVARNHDESFAGDVGDAEPAAMEAAALAHHLAAHPTHRDSTVISMLVLSAHWKHLKPAIGGQGLDHYAELQLAHAASVNRAEARVAVTPSADSRVEGTLKAPGEFSEETPQLSGGQVGPHLRAQREALQGLARRVDLIGRRVRDEQVLVREELGLQTWLLEEWCETAGVAWQDVECEAAPLFAAFELARRTALRVPFADAPSLMGSTLAKAGRDANASVSPYQSVVAAHSAIPQLFEEPPNDRLFPLSAAFVAVAAGDSDRAQRSAGTRKRRALAIAFQAYREILILQILATSDG